MGGRDVSVDAKLSKTAPARSTLPAAEQQGAAPHPTGTDSTKGI